MKLAVISAGLSRPSSTRLLADRLTAAAVAKLDDVGAEVSVDFVELRDLAVDIAKNMVSGFPSAQLRAAIDTVTAADGVIAVSPIFTASYSGLFKSFFDVIEDTALVGKPVLIAATGGTGRHSLALEHALRPMFVYLRMVVAPTSVYVATDDWGGTEQDITSRIGRAADELAALMANKPIPVVPPSVLPFEQQLAALRKS
ncbi:FMN reductase [Actinocrispum sp. NPDC049592]|uniref:FMN reductase n=1 Tax=Actinocrispum sp. NPDC049592 TaxID=3154835 RepID=UPI00342DC55E